MLIFGGKKHILKASNIDVLRINTFDYRKAEMKDFIIDSEKTALLKYPELLVSKNESFDEEFTVYAAPKLSNSAQCRICHYQYVQQRGYKARKIKDYVMINGQVTPITVTFKQRQYCCALSHYYLEEVGCYPKGATISERLEKCLFFFNTIEGSKTNIAKLFNMSWGTFYDRVVKMRKQIEKADLKITSPRIMAIREVHINGIAYTIIANMDDSTLIMFKAGTPREILCSIPSSTCRQLFAKTEIIIVDPQCNFVTILKARNSKCRICLDTTTLRNDLQSYLIKSAKECLSNYMSNKFLSCSNRGIGYLSQYELNFMNRIFADYPKLKRIYDAYANYDYYREKLSKKALDKMDIDTESKEKYADFVDFLLTSELLNKELHEECDEEIIVTRQLYYQFWNLIEYIVRDASTNAKKLSSESIIDRYYRCVPSTYKEHGSIYTKKRFQCFDTELDYLKKYDFIGKGFRDIENNIIYKNNVNEARTIYTEPDILYEI